MFGTPADQEDAVESQEISKLVLKRGSTENENSIATRAKTESSTGDEDKMSTLVWAARKLNDNAYKLEDLVEESLREGISKNEPRTRYLAISRDFRGVRKDVYKNHTIFR